jgi:hypothetical protein
MDIILATNSSFNTKPYLRESHNCYSYLLNLKSQEAEVLCEKEYKNLNYCRRSQPGYAAGYPPLNKSQLTCPEVMKRTLADNPNIRRISKQDRCSVDSYKGALVVDPGSDYHYYRLNDEGYWTHKPGYKPSTKYDASGNMITDPEKANRNYGKLNYKDFCGYFCVPRKSTKKRMYHISRVNRPVPFVNAPAHKIAQHSPLAKAPVYAPTRRKRKRLNRVPTRRKRIFKKGV